MALNEILKNVYTFANILVQAHDEVVRGWNERSLQNAFNWAQYCKKVENETRNKTYRADLDRHIRSLTILLNPVSLLHLDIDSLAEAPFFLTKVLRENPYLPKALEVQVQEAFRDSPGSKPNDSKKEKSTLEQSSNDFRLYLLLGDDTWKCSNCKKQGQYILDRLVSLYELCGASHRYGRFVERIVAEFVRVEDGMNLLVCALLTDIMDIKQHNITVLVKEQLMQCLMSCDNRLLSTCDISLVCEACQMDDGFMSFYTQYLESWGSSMYQVYGLTEDGQLYHWRCSQDVTEKRTYNDLFSCIINLLNSGIRLKNKLLRMINTNSEKSYVNVWRDLFRQYHNSYS